MTIRKLVRITSLSFLTLLSVVCMATLSHARTVSVDWGTPIVTGGLADGALASQTQDTSDEIIATRADALNKAVVLATLEEAFALLPEKMGDAQKKALTKYISMKAPLLVRGYREEGTKTLATGQQRLTVNVNVDRQWLTDALQRLGIYYTVRNPHEQISCIFYYLGQTEADKKSSAYKKASSFVSLLSTAAGLRSEGLRFLTKAELADMDRLAGVGQFAPINTMDASQPASQSNGQTDAISEALNAAKVSVGTTQSSEAPQTAQASTVPENPKGPQSLRFIIVPEGKDAWSAKLQDPQYDASAEGKSIDAVWEKLWPAYLSSRVTLEASASDMSSLQVWGWSSADGVVALDKAMRKWYKDQGGDVNDLDLLKITMQSGAVKAVWRVDITDKTKLKAFVLDYAEQRRLRYELTNLAQGLDAGQ
ncbi:MAG: hypothetical protein R3Y11_04785 [Pseudomonadota bacterium]